MQDPPSSQRFSTPSLEELRNQPLETEPRPAGPTPARTNVGKILARRQDELMAIEGVAMVGEGQDEIGRPAIIVGVKLPHQLKALPKSIDGVCIIGSVIGEVDAYPGRP